MNEAYIFDSHRYFKNLIANEFTEQQAEALTSEQIAFLNINLATKTDFAEIRSRLVRLEAKIDAVHEEIQRRR